MKRLATISLLVFFLLISCSQISNNDIAVVNGHKISSDELYQYIPKTTFVSMDAEDKERQVKRICDDYMARYFLEEQGVFDSGDIYWEITSWEIRELANKAYQHLVINKILNDKTLRTLYDKLKYQLNVSHILIAHNDATGNLNERSKEDALRLADSIYKSINTDDFTDYVLKYSDDISKEENRGNLGWGTSGTWLESFENAVFELAPGNISKPVETKFGYHIIKLNERRETPIEPFDKMHAELVDMAYNRWSLKFASRENEVFDSLMTARPLELDDSLVADFVDRFVRLSNNVFDSEQYTAFDIMTVLNDSLKVGYLGETPIDKKWIYKYLKLMSIQRPNRFSDEKSFRGFIAQNHLGDLLYHAAINSELDKSKEYLQIKNVFLAKKASSVFDKHYVFEKINPDSRELRDFYDKMKSDIYKIDARVRVREVLLEDSLMAIDILRRIKNGEDIADLATKYSIRNMGKKNNGLIPAMMRDQFGEMSRAAFDMEDGEIGGPFRIGDHYSVIKREAYMPESFRSYDDVAYRLLTDYRRHYAPQKRLEQNKMLHEKYSVRINPSYLK